MSAYYNEIDNYAAQWLRNLIAAGHIAPGDVDERSIEEVTADDLRGYTQCHFFAGIAGWSYALRLAGWPDDREVWTGSCPCQPFSVAGSQGGAADKRHLWPAFFRLISQRRPATVFGEQVASAPGRDWLCAVRLDLETLAYAVGAADLCAAGVGAPHIRQRLWWVADSCSERRQQDPRGAPAHEETNGGARRDGGKQDSDHLASGAGADGGMADSNCIERGPGHTKPNAGADGRDDAGRCGEIGRVVAPETSVRRRASGAGIKGGIAEIGRSGSWDRVQYLPCADGKARPTQPGLSPLADGLPGRVGQLRAYGNAIVPQVAAEFIGAFMDVL